MQIQATARGLAALLLAAVAVPASADTIRLDDFVHPTAPRQALAFDITYGATSKAVYAGEFSGLLNGASFTTYCSDLDQSFSWGTTYTVTPQDFTPVQGSLLGKLFYAHAADVVDYKTSAAFQLALWEIVYGDGTDVKSGSAFRATGLSGDHLWAADTANGWLGGLGSVSSAYVVKRLYNGILQDQVVVTVPEPETYAMMLAGLGLLGALGRRRTNRG